MKLQKTHFREKVYLLHLKKIHFKKLKINQNYPIKLQKKTFTKWFNLFPTSLKIKKRKLNIENLVFFLSK